MADHSEDIAAFISVTGATPEQAQQFLAMTDYAVQDAVNAFYQTAGESEGEEEEEVDEELPGAATSQAPSTIATAPPSFGAGRRLGEPGDSIAPTSAASSSTPSLSRDVPPHPKKKLMSLKDLQSDSHAGHGHGPGDDDDSDKEQEYYAGGDKSGLAVQDPSVSSHRDQIQRLMNTARRGGAQRPPRRNEPEQAVQPSHFTGAGVTLGGDEAESRVIPAGPATQVHRPVEMVERILHLWEDGFSIDDGDLYRYDDPANRAILDMINAGSAPMDLMNVRNGQAVDVKLDDHRGQKYVQPKKKYKPFGGSGNRLGSPTSGPTITATPSAPAPNVMTQSTLPEVEVDVTQPALNLQVRLADGTRLPTRFNTTHTMEDVYRFVDQAVPGGQQRPYVLATTFPTRDLTDKNQVLGDMPEFKRGGVVVQKWT